MEEQLELIGIKRKKPGCNFSHWPAADTWMVNLRITDSEKFPFVYCDQCSRPDCFRRRNHESSNYWPEVGCPAESSVPWTVRPPA
jgi:hypothetical protein